MILSFADAQAEAIFAGRSPGKGFPPELVRPALRKLAMLDAAMTLQDLASPPGNRLEALKGNRLGQHAIRINGQFRNCLVWVGHGAEDVEIVDYH